MHYELKEAHVSELFLAKVTKAEEVFWDTYTTEFKEVTSGDSQLCDEPSNTIATWLAQYDGVKLPVLTMPQYDLNLPKGCSESRVEKTLNRAIKNMVEVLKEDIPSLEKPTPQIKQLMLMVYNDVLHWNFPQKKTKKNSI